MFPIIGEILQLLALAVEYTVREGVHLEKWVPFPAIQEANHASCSPKSSTSAQADLTEVRLVCTEWTGSTEISYHQRKSQTEYALLAASVIGKRPIRNSLLCNTGNTVVLVICVIWVGGFGWDTEFRSN